jgi:PadR family transcriptional regulator, regulatory protein PadR
MSRPVEDLGLLEQQVLLACLRLHPNGYGVAIGDEIKRRTAKDYSPGSIYAAIERLENKGCVERRKGEATAVRGGRAKEYFTVSAIGRKALEDARRVVAAMEMDLNIPGLARC